MTKKLLAMVFTSLLILNLSACGKSEEDKKAEESKKALMGERP